MMRSWMRRRNNFAALCVRAPQKATPSRSGTQLGPQPGRQLARLPPSRPRHRLRPVRAQKLLRPRHSRPRHPLRVSHQLMLCQPPLRQPLLHQPRNPLRGQRPARLRRRSKTALPRHRIHRISRILRRSRQRHGALHQNLQHSKGAQPTTMPPPDLLRRSPRVCSPQVRSLQVRPLQVRPRQVRQSQVRPLQVRRRRLPTWCSRLRIGCHLKPHLMASRPCGWS